MKVKDLVNKCGLAATYFHFYECGRLEWKVEAGKIKVDLPVMERTVNTFRVKDSYLEIYLKPQT